MVSYSGLFNFCPSIVLETLVWCSWRQHRCRMTSIGELNLKIFKHVWRTQFRVRYVWGKRHHLLVSAWGNLSRLWYGINHFSSLKVQISQILSSNMSSCVIVKERTSPHCKALLVLSLSLSLSLSIYIYIYIYICAHVYVRVFALDLQRSYLKETFSMLIIDHFIFLFWERRQCKI